jgi:HAMP domain-containing protein/class 3 adenylate cyclase
MTATPTDAQELTDPTADATPDPRRRGRSARAEVAFFFIGISLLSVVALSVFNFFAARELINGLVETSLVDIGSTRATRIENGVRGLQESTATLAADLGVIGALDDLSDGYAALNEPLTPAQEGELANFYERTLSETGIPGVTPVTPDQLLPASERAQYLQYHYLVQNPNAPDRRAELDDAGDGSQYSVAHALNHPTLRAMRDALGFGDLLLIDASTASVVYTVDKRIDLGTDLDSGPHRDSSLARVIIEGLNEAAAGDAVVIDFQPYAPAGGAPTLFAAAAIRDGRRLVGALAVEIPSELLTEVTTAGGDWEGTGLGETGEVYVVGRDSRMRSESRLWLEQPTEYLERVDEAGYAPVVADAVDAFGTTVLIQPVDTEGVQAALAGDLFIERSVNYLGDEVFTAAGPLDVGTLGWVVVAEATEAEVYAPLNSFLWRMLILAAILVPILSVLGFYLATRMVRPVAPILDASRQVAAGDLGIELPVDSRDEFGDLAENFNGLVQAMRQEQSALLKAESETNELLGAVLPSRLVDQVQSGEDVAQSVRNITVIALALDIPEIDDPLTQQLIVDHGVELAAAITRVAGEHGVEALRSSAAQLVYASGLDVSDAETGHALEFVVAVGDLIREMGERDEIDTVFGAGLAAGDVVTGVVGADRMYFDVWGEPRRRAMALADKAGPGQILVDATVAETSGDDWIGEAVGVIDDRTGIPLDAWAVTIPAGNATPRV